MAKIIGRLNSLGIGKESTRGTAVTAGMWVPTMDLEYEDNVKTAVDEASHARIESSDGELVTATYGEASIKSKIKDQTFGYLLLSLLGTDTPAAQSAPNAAVYDHVFTVNQTTQHQSLSLALKGPNDDVVMANSVIESLKISSEMNKFVMFEAKALGKASQSASNTVSFTAENDFTSKHVTFKIAATQADLAAASAVSIRKFEMEIKTAAILEEVLGGTPINDVLSQSFEVSGSVTIVHTDATYQALMLAGTYKALRFQLLNTDVTIGSNTNPKLVIDLHRCILNSRKRKMALNDLVEETFTFKAHYSLTDSKMISCTLSNTKASY